MRYENGRKISLDDFIIDTIAEMPGVPEDINIKVLRQTSEMIVSEVTKQIEYNLSSLTNEVTE